MIRLLHLLFHDVFQFLVVPLFEKTLISPVGRQRFHNIESAVVRYEAVVVQIIRQIRDL